jgi:hypothetical protein
MRLGRRALASPLGCAASDRGPSLGEVTALRASGQLLAASRAAIRRGCGAVGTGSLWRRASRPEGGLFAAASCRLRRLTLRRRRAVRLADPDVGFNDRCARALFQLGRRSCRRSHDPVGGSRTRHRGPLRRARVHEFNNDWTLSLGGSVAGVMSLEQLADGRFRLVPPSTPGTYEVWVHATNRHDTRESTSYVFRWIVPAD